LSGRIYTTIPLILLIADLYKEVEIRMQHSSFKLHPSSPHHEGIHYKLHNEVVGETVPVVHRVVPIISGFHCGNVKVVIKSMCEPVMKGVYNTQAS